MIKTIYIADKSLSELESLFMCEIDDADFYDSIACNIAQENPYYLLDNIKNYSGMRKRAAIFGLGSSLVKDEKITKEILLATHDTDPLVVSRAINALIDLEHKQYWSHIQPLLNNESPFVKGAVLTYARYVEAEKVYELLVSSLTDTHYIVREYAIDELAELGNIEAIEKIKPLLNDVHPHVRQAAESAIKELSNNS